jgi:hypothetical protein
VDDRELRKLQSAAEHERGVADAATTAVDLVAAKVERAKAAVIAAEDAFAGTEREAELTAARADAAEAAYREAADGMDVAVGAGVAEGKAI